MKKLTTYFTKGELALWGGSAGLILVSFFLFDRVNFMTLAASLIGTTSLIFNAKGNPIGQALMILFSLLYGVISHLFLLWGDDHLPRHDRADGTLRSCFLASQSLQRKPRGGGGEPA